MIRNSPVTCHNLFQAICRPSNMRENCRYVEFKKLLCRIVGFRSVYPSSCFVHRKHTLRRDKNTQHSSRKRASCFNSFSGNLSKGLTRTSVTCHGEKMLHSFKSQYYRISILRHNISRFVKSGDNFNDIFSEFNGKK